MSTDLLRTAGANPQLDEKAQRAVKNFRSLQPTLSAYARAITGRGEVRVEMAAKDNGSTDGTRIFYRPPIDLGDDTVHDRSQCNKRNPDTDLMLCAACRVREQVLVTIYHEISHIAFDSFQKVSNFDKRRAIEWAIKEAKGAYREKIEARIASAPDWKKQDFINLASLINEYLPTIINALEDARVNSELFKHMPGTQRMFDADTVNVFEKGVEHVDINGNISYGMWSDAPQNSQAIIGVFCMASGYTRYEDWLCDPVARAMRDEKLNEIVGRIKLINTAQQVFSLSFHVLQRLRELGFCGTPQDPDPEPEESDEADEPEDQADDSSSDSEASDDSEGSDPEGDQPGGDDVSEDGESDETEDASGQAGGQRPKEAGDESDDSEVSDSAGNDEGDEVDEKPDDTDSDDEASEQGNSSESSDGGDESGVDPEQEGSSDDSQPSGESGADQPSESRDSEQDGGSTGSPDLSDEAGEQDASDGPSDGGLDSDSVDNEPDSDGQDDGESNLSDGSSGPSEETDQAGSEAGEPVSQPDADEADGDERSESGSPVEDNSLHPEIDTGADDGYGGTQLLGDEPEDVPEMGEPDDADPVIKMFGAHEEKPKSIEATEADTAVDRAIVQGIYFTSPSKTVWGVREHNYGEDLIIDGLNYTQYWLTGAFEGSEIDIAQTILSPGLMKLRRAFSDNQRGHREVGLKSGKVNTKSLGSKAPFGDPRIFRKDRAPGRKSYYVLLEMDISGSTVGRNLELEKRAVFAQAELLSRTGVEFEIIAHTADDHSQKRSDRGGWGSGGWDMDVYWIKNKDEKWNDKTRERLTKLRSGNANLDGHALEFGRKLADKSQATDKIIMYYSDGKFPAANANEELEVFIREQRTCAQKQYTLLGVGIRTDSPKAHGLDTVEFHEDEDLIKVVEHLARRLSVGIRR